MIIESKVGGYRWKVFYDEDSFSTKCILQKSRLIGYKNINTQEVIQPAKDGEDLLAKVSKFDEMFSSRIKGEEQHINVVNELSL